MSRRLKIRIAVGLLIAAAVLCARLNDGGKAKLLTYRRALSQQGFKTNYSQLDLSTTLEQRERGEALLAAAEASRELFPFRELSPMRTADEQSARVISKTATISPASGMDVWAAARTNFESVKAPLDSACAALASGSFRLEPTNWMRAAQLRFLSQAFPARLVLALHDGDRASAWTNLQASIQLAARWDVEPSEALCLIRFAAFTAAQRATWEAMQWPAWTEGELAELQRQWEHSDCFRSVPQTAVTSIAIAAPLFDYHRQLPPPPPVSLRQVWSDLLTAPESAWRELTAKRSTPASLASYGNELAFLQFYKKRYEQFRRINPSTPWKEIRGWNDVTNSPPVAAASYPLFPDRSHSLPNAFPFRGDQGSFVGRLALAEARRRLSITALALERYRLASGTLPHDLSSLLPSFLSIMPVDFMDGEPLRYKLAGSDQFLLYSVGLDCKDDGGKMTPLDAQRTGFGRGGFFRQDGPDVLWPLPAN